MNVAAAVSGVKEVASAVKGYYASLKCDSLPTNTASQHSPIENANYAQTSYGPKFSKTGKSIYTELVGKPIDTLDDLVNAIKDGTINPSAIPVEYIVRDGNVLILNTRTAHVLTKAGIDRTAWNIINKTGNPISEELLTNPLIHNKLTSLGTDTARMTGGK